MKKMYLMIFWTFQILILYGQSNEKKLLIDITGAYYSHKDNVSIGGNGNELTSKNGKISIGVNYRISNILYIGLGFDYLNCNEKQDISYFNNDDANNNTFLLSNSISLKNSIFTPSINVKLFKLLSDKWFIGLNVLNGLSFINTKSESTSAMEVIYPTNSLPFLKGTNSTQDKSYYLISFEPELRYFISDKLSLKLLITGFRFDTLNKGQFFCFSKSNEIFWSLGLGLGLK